MLLTFLVAATNTNSYKISVYLNIKDYMIVYIFEICGNFTDIYRNFYFKPLYNFQKKKYCLLSKIKLI